MSSEPNITERFKYYVASATPIRDYSRAFELVREEKLVIDSKYLEVIEAAEQGHCIAWLELQEGFRLGRKGLPQNYRLARHYSDIMIRECTEDETLRQAPQLLFESYRAAGVLEMMFQNIPRALAEMTEAVRIMVNQLPFSKWDLYIFEYLKEISLHHTEPSGE